MPEQPPPSLFRQIRPLLPPALVALALAAALYYGGSTYQTIGLAAFDSTRQILGYVLGMGLVLFLTVFSQRLIQHLLLEGLVARALGTPVPRLLIQISTVIVYLVGFAAMAGIVFKQDLTALWAASGIAGFVFGMALREPILDIFTGLAINLDRPIRIGDDVLLHKAGDQTIEGKVLEISWRTTRIADLSGNVVVLPNSRLAAATITNYSQPRDWFGASVKVTLDADVPPERAQRILSAAAAEGMTGLTPPGGFDPGCFVREITPAGVDYAVMFATRLDNRFTARSRVQSAILNHLARAGLRPAWPKLEQATASSGGARSEPSPAQLALLLAATDLFHGLPPEELERLATTLTLRRPDTGATLVQSGEIADRALLLLEGLAEALPSRSDANRSRTSRTLGPGNLIGDEALLTGDGHPRSVRTRTPSLVAEIGHRAICQLLLRRPELAATFATRLAARTRQTRTPSSPRLSGSGDDLAGDLHAALRRTFADLRLP